MTNPRTLTFSEYIAAPVSQVYRAFATQQGLQEWFADVVEADAREGGRFYAWWNVGFYANGLFKAAVKDEKVKFTWQAVGEPGETTVVVTLEPRDGGTQLTITHKGLGEGEAWDAVETNYKREWPSGLSNLKSVLETGVDKRLYDRPMLGFFIGGLVDEAMQKRLNVPVDYGLHVAGTLPGMGAKRSGLKQDDVIAEVAGAEVRTFQTLGPVLSKYKGGEVLNTVIYRNGERIELDIELSRRPVPDFPPPPADLAKLGRAVYKDVLKELKTVLKGATDDETGRNPGDGEWSVREAMAHLLVGERTSQAAWDRLAENETFPGYPGSSRLTAAIAQAYSTKRLLKELKRSIAVNMTMIETLPEAYYENKGAYFVMANDYENGIRTHWAQHTEQIKTALEAARAAVAE
ncbi:MAG TPA: SRPBCC domain-containing protein [Anaerolineales bacterium]|nr:SRPBCC domain-containing protein [Anaerolineales bacterium]